MAGRTKLKETVVSGEYGDYHLMHGKEGSNWRPIKVDNTGKVDVT